jgi:magnesium transporter
VRFPSSQEEAEIEASSRYQVEDDYVRISLRVLELCALEQNSLHLQEQSLSVLWLPTKLITLRKQNTRLLAELSAPTQNRHSTPQNPPPPPLSPLRTNRRYGRRPCGASVPSHLPPLHRNQNFSDANVQQRIVLRIQLLQELVIRLREALFDIQRVLSLLIRSQSFTEDNRETIRILLKDISSLIDHTNFAFQRLEALQNTILSLINIEQNRIIKIFTVITVAFMPPTLIASVYGMNFEFMPELHWKYGYLFAWIVILASSLVTIWYFRWRRWL